MSQRIATEECIVCAAREVFPVRYTNEEVSWETCPICGNEYVQNVQAKFLWENCAICEQEFDQGEMFFNRTGELYVYECMPCVKKRLER